MKNRYYMLETDEDNKSAELYIFGDITSWPWYEGDESSYGLVKKLQNQLHRKSKILRLKALKSVLY